MAKPASRTILKAAMGRVGDEPRRPLACKAIRLGSRLRNYGPHPLTKSPVATPAAGLFPF